MPGCGSTSCDCLMVNPSFYNTDNLIIEKQNHTIIHGVGSQADPFYIENIFAQNFMPPAAKLRTIINIPAATSMFIPFEIVDINTAGMWVPYDNTKIRIQYSGYYMFGASILWNETPADAGKNIELGIYTGDGASVSSGTFGVVYQQSKDENPSTSTHKTTGQTENFMSIDFGTLQFLAGTTLRVGLVSTVNVGATLASFWCCYV